jgi:hypothetical protein
MTPSAMPPSGPLDALGTLRAVNENLRSALVRLRPEQTQCSSIKPEELSALVAELRRAAECVRTPQAQSEATAALEYRRNLDRLRQILPGLHLRLLAEKSQLEAARTQVAAADAWACASKKTL